MFDKLLDWLLSIWEDLWPLFKIREYEQGIILRNGKYVRVCNKGLHWKWFFIDEVVTQHIVTTTINLPAQSLVTKDNRDIVVKAVVKYKISDVKVFLLEVYDSVDAISDVAQGIVKNVIMSNNWEDCKSDELDNTITKKVRNELKKFGVYIEAVTLTDLASIKSLRLFNQNEIVTNG